MKRMNKVGGEEENLSPCNKHPRLGPAESVRLLENQILTNSLITDRIFSDIPYSDLLHFSLISKAWNLTCRGILLDRFETDLTLSEKSTVEVLENLYNLISNAVPGHQHPVNGIRINFDYPVPEWPFTSETFVGLMSRIMNQMEVKFVSFDMSNLHLRATEFHDIFKTLVIPHLGTIESLEILNFDGLGNLKTLTQQLSVDSCPSLKKLELAESQNRLKISTFKKILRACPNLKKISLVWPYQFPTLKNTNKLHSASAVEFNYMKLTPKDIQLLVEYSGLIKELKISQQKKAKRNKFEGEWISRLQPIFSSQLKLSLEFLNISLELLVGILLQNSFTPQKLKELYVVGSQEWFPSLFKSNTGHVANFIPNLRSLTVFWTPYRSKFLQRTFGDENEAGPLSLYQRNTAGSLDSVRVLKLVGIEHRGEDKYETLMKLMNLDEAFPWVTHLEIDFRHSDLGDLFQWICESWGDLLQSLILRKTECSRLMKYAFVDNNNENESVPHVGESFLEAIQHKRKPLPAGTSYLYKLSHLFRLEIDFHHPARGICEQGYEQEKTKVETTFRTQTGQQVRLFITGCRAQKRLARVICGLSIYEILMMLHSCPQDLELSPIEEIIGKESISKRICKNLTTKDLLNCSLVSRRWSVTARNELYKNRSCTLTLNPLTYDEGGSPCKIMWLGSRGLEFFNALRIKSELSTPYVNDSSWAVRVNRVHLERDDLKHRRFKVLEVSGPDPPAERHQNLYEDFDFNDVSAMLEIFLKSILRKLELDHVQALTTSIENFDRLFRDYGGNLLVPNLQSIDFDDTEKLIDYPKVAKRLFEDLTNLERIEDSFSNKLLPHIASANRAHCVKHIQLYELPENETLLDGEIHSEGASSEVMTLEDPRTALGSLLKFAQEHQPRIESLSVSGDVLWSQKNQLVFGKVFQNLCASSFESLHTLSLSLSQLVLVSKVYSRPMVALNCINLEYDQGDFDPVRLLCQIPLHHMVPSLTQVCIKRSIRFCSDPDTSSPEGHLPQTCQGNPQPCLSVRTITLQAVSNSEEELNSSSLKSWSIESLARMFPNVENFTFDSIARSENKFPIFLSSIWEHWTSLETFTLRDKARLSAVTFETWILGISEEEWTVWKELQLDGSTGELVKTMDYAPSTFSFRNCTNLKEFSVGPNIETVIVKRTNDDYSTRLRLFPLILEEALEEPEAESESDEESVEDD